MNLINPAVIIHKDDDGRIDMPVIYHDPKGKEFTLKSALRYMKKHNLTSQDFRSGWFASNTIALARARWAI